MQQQQTFLHPASSSADSTPLKPPPNVGLKADPPMSPANSYRSHSEFTEGELDDVQPLDDPTVLPGQRGFGEMEPTDGKKKPFWKRRKGESVSYSASNSYPEAERSRVSVTSGDGRKSLAMDRALGSMSDPESFNDSKDKSHSSWIGRKLAERAEKKEERDRIREETRDDKRRAKSPPPPLFEQNLARAGGASMQSLTAATADGGQRSPSIPIPARSGKSIDIRRERHDRPRSFDVGNDQLSVIVSNPSKKSMDVGSRERKSLLELGEEHVAAQRNADAIVAQRNVDATAAATAALSHRTAATVQKDLGASSAAAAAFASASAAGKGDNR
jgi:hypothetical protein